MDGNREIELKEIIKIANSFDEMSVTEGWKTLRQMILDRSASLSKVLATEMDEKKLYRTQGEFLGIQSILNILSATKEDSELAQQELKNMEEENGKTEN